MSDGAVNATADSRARRLTWVTGGILLLLSVVIWFTARGELAGFAIAKDAVFASAAVLFVIGVGRAGSVTALRPVSTVATLALAVTPFAQSLWFGLVPESPGDPNAREDAWVLAAALYYGSLAALAIIAAVGIGRAGVLPSPWRWAPLWVVFWTPLAFVVGITVSSSAPFGTAISRIAGHLVLDGPAIGTVFLGIVALVLGIREQRLRVAPVTIT